MKVPDSGFVFISLDPQYPGQWCNILGIKATIAVVSHKSDVCKYPVCRGVELGKVLATEVRVCLCHYFLTPFSSARLDPIRTYY